MFFLSTNVFKRGFKNLQFDVIHICREQKFKLSVKAHLTFQMGNTADNFSLGTSKTCKTSSTILRESSPVDEAGNDRDE